MISIIVPVYNVKCYLEQCLQSIACQNYTNFECILVDDGSSDGSSDICDQWKLRDSRIKVIHQTNRGVSATRNVGIKHSHGDYITFIDSDDWVTENYLTDLIGPMLQFNADLVVSGLRKDFTNGTFKDYSPKDSYHFDLDSAHIEDFVDLNEKFLLYGPVVKLYCREIIINNMVYFDESCSYGEDLKFNYQYLKYVTKIACSNHIDYHYRIIGKGTLSSVFRSDQFDIDYEQWKILKKFYCCRNLWNKVSKESLYKRLWGIVYDGVFLFPKIKHRKYSYLSHVFGIKEISDLSDFEYVFHSKQWIKRGILKRRSMLFYLFLMTK